MEEGSYTIPTSIITSHTNLTGMGVDQSQWNFVGTSRLNPSGSTGTGSATIPKAVAEQFYKDGAGVDMVVFKNGRKIMLVPSEEVNIQA